VRSLRFRRVAVVATVASVCLVLPACSKFTGSTATKSAKEISFWVPDKGTNTPGLKPALAEFTQQTGIKVDLFEYPNDGVSKTLEHAIGTSTFPDVYQGDTGIGLSAPFLEAKAVAPLDKYYAKYGWDSKLDSAGIQLATFNGQKLAVPYNVNGMGIVYSKAAFTKAGITAPPATFDEFTADMAKLKSVGITPLSFAGKQPWDSMRLLDSILETKCGSATFDQLRALKISWTDTPCATAGFDQLASWVKGGDLVKGFMGLDPNSNAMYTPIYQGKAAMTIDGDWSIGTLTGAKKDPADFGIFAFPTDTNRMYYFTASLWVSSKSKKQDLSAQLINYLVSSAVQTKYFGQLGTTVSPTNGITPPASLVAYSADWYKLITGFPHAFQPSDQALPPDVVTSYERGLQKVELSQQTGAQAVAALQADIATYKSKQS
jgi:raffinose/stachyose/melibiose transport system substrate-binding protein